MVWSYDVVKSQWTQRTVRQAFRNEITDLYAFVEVGGETIESTFRHPFWVIEGEALAARPNEEHLAPVPANATTPGRWVDAGDLRAGDVLLLLGSKPARVASVRYEQKTQPVFNFAVDELQCYAVGKNGVLVHNTNGKEAVEEASRVRAENATGQRLYKSTDEVVDWVDDAGRTYDQIGNPATVAHWRSQRAQFLSQIDRHLMKADFVVVDLTGFSPAIKREVSNYISNLSQSLIDRVIPIGF